MQRRIAVVAVFVMIALAACASPSKPAAGGTASTPTPTSSPAPAVTPTAAPSPSMSMSVPSASPTVAPAPPTPKPAPPATSAKPISCTGKIAQTRPVASGAGPGGSLVSTGSPAVALTFDDGPDPINTPKILDELKQCGVKATFCVVGFRARDHPEMITRIAAEGHTLCNHSWQHLFDLAKRDDAYIRKDLENTNKMILRAAPGARVAYFRAPGGNFTTKLVRIASELGMKSIYWHVDPRDWESAKFGKGTAMVNHIIAAVERDVRPGSIVLSHDNGKPDTIVAYRTLLPWLKARYTLIALPDAPPPPPSPAPATPLP
ncbi:polysaccharide deacetylase family protein [Catellatospora chokoriensis]|uniref:polysaccharide deacetylase family protein n=1 Tax=Catellatospora chokoriensis TaxID=310353 RepID=UPI001EF2A133|nr:polysaccharide deacetylase family protein [Catellatospora chokoriensis]